MNACGESIAVMHPLFQTGEGGAIPTSPLQLEIGPMPIRKALELNQAWHSRLPQLTNWQACEAFCAVYEGIYYACAIWGQPVARMLNGRGFYELRRMAIADNAPANTGSRMLRVMRLLIQRARPELTKLISYQDTEVHKGTIYRAAGWAAVKVSDGGEWSRPSRGRASVQAASPKVRWEYDLK